MMNNNEVITPTNRYACNKCFHIYSPWLTNKCPKCKHPSASLSSDSYIDVPLDFDYGTVNVTVTGINYTTPIKPTK